jgi:hypothetical protein
VNNEIILCVVAVLAAATFVFCVGLAVLPGKASKARK